MSEVDCAQGHYGSYPMMQSASKPDTVLRDLKDLTPELADQKVWIRARLQTSRSKGSQLNGLISLSVCL